MLGKRFCKRQWLGKRKRCSPGWQQHRNAQLGDRLRYRLVEHQWRDRQPPQHLRHDVAFGILERRSERQRIRIYQWQRNDL